MPPRRRATSYSTTVGRLVWVPCVAKKQRWGRLVARGITVPVRSRIAWRRAVVGEWKWSSWFTYCWTCSCSHVATSQPLGGSYCFALTVVCNLPLDGMWVSYWPIHESRSLYRYILHPIHESWKQLPWPGLYEALWSELQLMVFCKC